MPRMMPMEPTTASAFHGCSPTYFSAVATASSERSWIASCTSESLSFASSSLFWKTPTAECARDFAADSAVVIAVSFGCDGTGQSSVFQCPGLQQCSCQSSRASGKVSDTSILATNRYPVRNEQSSQARKNYAAV